MHSDDKVSAKLRSNAECDKDKLSTGVESYLLVSEEVSFGSVYPRIHCLTSINNTYKKKL